MHKQVGRKYIKQWISCFLLRMLNHCTEILIKFKANSILYKYCKNIEFFFCFRYSMKTRNWIDAREKEKSEELDSVMPNIYGSMNGNSRAFLKGRINAIFICPTLVTDVKLIWYWFIKCFVTRYRMRWHSLFMRSE